MKNTVSIKLRELGRAMDKAIDAKMNPATAKQNPTPRRMRILEGMRQEAIHLMKVQDALFRLADAHDDETLAPCLAPLTNKAIVETILATPKYPEGQSPWASTERTRLAQYDISSAEQFNVVREALLAICDGRIGQASPQQAIKDMERALVGKKIDGYFPTPRAVVLEMITYAAIEPGETVLEPSAGKGNISDVVREMYPDTLLSVVEWNWTLREILTKKEYELSGSDIFDVTGQWDVILMNPPFEQMADITHVQYCYDHLLKPSGRLVALMSESPFFRQDKRAVAFREWLDNVGYAMELGEAFKDSERPTSVRVRMVVLDKPAGVISPLPVSEAKVDVMPAPVIGERVMPEAFVKVQKAMDGFGVGDRVIELKRPKLRQLELFAMPDVKATS